MRKIKTARQIGPSNKLLENPSLKSDPFQANIKYKCVDDDIVDKMLEDFIKSHNVKVPFNRIDRSKYLFGTRLIAA